MDERVGDGWISGQIQRWRLHGWINKMGKMMDGKING